MIAITVSAQLEKEPNHYTVVANITTSNPNISPDATVTCYFNIFAYGEYSFTITKQLSFTGDDEYEFNSDYVFHSYNDWTFEIIGRDGEYCFDDCQGFQEDWYVTVNETFVYHCSWQ